MSLCLLVISLSLSLLLWIVLILCLCLIVFFHISLCPSVSACLLVSICRPYPSISLCGSTLLHGLVSIVRPLLLMSFSSYGAIPFIWAWRPQSLRRLLLIRSSLIFICLWRLCLQNQQFVKAGVSEWWRRVRHRETHWERNRQTDRCTRRDRYTL